MNTSPSTHPTTSDIGQFMQELNYEWSNQAQIFYYAIPCLCLPKHHTIQTIDRNTAEHIYKCSIGNNPFQNYYSIKEIECEASPNCKCDDCQKEAEDELITVAR